VAYYAGFAGRLRVCGSGWGGALEPGGGCVLRFSRCRVVNLAVVCVGGAVLFGAVMEHAYI